MYIGYERPCAAKMRGVAAAIGAHARYLHDYPELAGRRWATDIGDGEDAEITWPEGVIDQTRLRAMVRACGWDDAEEDDPPGGNITDEPHDAREEDGI